MSTTSNLYAEKVFAEHPIALWSMDDTADYVSIITEEERDLSDVAWTITGGTLGTFSDSLPAPIFDGSVISRVVTPDISSGTGTVSITSGVLGTSLSIDPTIKTLSVSTYLYPYSKFVDVEIGINYSISSVSQEPITKTLHVSSTEQWAFISEMFKIPTNAEDISLVFNVSYEAPSTSYSFLIHGITYGQLSEQFNVESLGSVTDTIENMQIADLRSPTIFDSSKGVRAVAYGLQPLAGYYLTNALNRLVATNSGMPMVYGTNNSTNLVPNDGQPSFVFPGMGVLNLSGQYSDLTVEMWMKIQSAATEPRRVFGPISSLDGLYVNDAFLALRVGTSSGSYYVGEWDRPMLVALRLSSKTASVTINGEEVININLNSEEVFYPSKFATISGVEYDQDWLGFYAYPDVPQINIDAIGIFPYIVPNVVEKRRWIYGQGVETPANIVGASPGSAVSIDYTVANYAKNYSYPDIGRFQQGINENLLIESNAISLPAYEKPTIKFNNKTIDEWYTDVSYLDETYGTAMSLKPNALWSDTDGYILFPSLNVLSQNTEAFYGLFESDAADETKQTLFYLENQITKESLEITLENTVINYMFSYTDMSGNTSSEVIYTDSYHTPGDFIFVGLDIQKFVSAFSGRLSSFFGTKQELKVYVGGSKTFSNTFSGKIYRIGFCTARNLQKISFAYTDSGIAAAYNSIDSLFTLDAEGFVGDSLVVTPSWDALADGGDAYFGNLDTGFEEVYDGGSVYSILVSKLLDHIASYTLTPKMYLGKFLLDISVNGYWQDYIPLSYFAKYVDDGNEGTYLDVDFVQFNISYPEIKKFLNQTYDTSKSIVKTYVSFQYLGNNSNINIPTNISPALKGGVVQPGADWETVRYEVVNDTIIYPPDNVDFNMVGLVLHIEILANGLTENPIKIRSIQLSSQALNAFIPNTVGTKYGASVVPYRKSAEYFDYKGRNPFSIYKGSTPYLYLTGTSGMRLRGLDTGTIIRGLSMPINKTRSNYYKISALQMSLRFDDETFPLEVTSIFEIEATGPEDSQSIKFYMIADDSNAQRGKIYAIDGKTGLPQDGIMFYINGRLVKTPVINRNSWTTLGLVFNTAVDFSTNGGAVRVTGPITFNNVSHYQVTRANELSRSSYRKWSGVNSIESITQPWTYWSGDSEALPPTTGFTWRGVLFIATIPSSPFDGTIIYEKYTGTDHIVVDSGSVLSMTAYQYQLYDNVSWRATITTPI